MWGPSPSVMGALGYWGRAMVELTPCFDLCCASLWPERGFGEFVWELPTLGPEAPSFSVEASRGSVWGYVP